MTNSEGVVLGGFIFVMPDKYLNYFRAPEDDISFILNVTKSSLYKIVKKNKYNNLAYDKYSASTMLYLQDMIDHYDRELFLDEAYNKLNSYSKDELIQMMLNKKLTKKITGKIK